MTTNYLEPTDSEAFVDFPSKKEPQPEQGLTEECPKCKGYGGWNLTLNAYPLHFHENTSENRHLFSHFRASCSHCSGWGWVGEEDANHVHDWQFKENLGNCLKLHECSICGKKWQIDSGD